jgi:hypothetical protein
MPSGIGAIKNYQDKTMPSNLNYSNVSSNVSSNENIVINNNDFEIIKQKRKLDIPEYPIRIKVKQNKDEIFLRNINGLEFSSKFNDAIKKVDDDLKNPNSFIMNEYKKSKFYKEGDKLRYSTSSTNFLVNNKQEIYNGNNFNFIYWNVLVTLDNESDTTKLKYDKQIGKNQSLYKGGIIKKKRTNKNFKKKRNNKSKINKKKSLKKYKRYNRK